MWWGMVGWALHMTKSYIQTTWLTTAMIAANSNTYGTGIGTGTGTGIGTATGTSTGIGLGTRFEKWWETSFTRNGRGCER